MTIKITRDRRGNIRWTEAMNARLIESWNEGVTVKKIAEKVSREWKDEIVKNVISGRIARLIAQGLVIGRPSPLRKASYAKPKTGARAPRIVAPLIAKPPTTPELRTAEPRKPAYIRSPRDCCWPINDRRPWRFCDAQAERGRSYCAHHARVGTQKTQPASGQDDAAPAV